MTRVHSGVSSLTPPQLYIYIYTCIHRYRQIDHSLACLCGAPRARAAARRVWRVTRELTHPPPRYLDGLAAAGLGLGKMSDSIPALNNQLATLDGKNSIRNSC